MTLTEFAQKYLPYQEGHDEDLTFLSDLEKVIPNKDETFLKFKKYIDNHPNIKK